jgi:hypothetical protein
MTAKSVSLRRWQWGELPTYNGFVHAERVRGWQLVCLLAEIGALPSPLSCAISGATEGPIAYHGEDYFAWSPHPLSKPMHFALHRRFNQPEPWLRIVDRYSKTGEEWWAKLALTPVHVAAQRRAVGGEQVADIFSRAPIPAGVHIDRRQIYGVTAYHA